jgi:hypothetical protein
MSEDIVWSDNRGAEDWDTIIMLDGRLYWWQPGKPSPLPEDGLMAVDGPPGSGDCLVFLDDDVVWRSWAEVAKGRHGAAYEAAFGKRGDGGWPS